MDLEHYLQLPWTITRTTRNDDGVYTVLQVSELPGFVVAGRTDDELNTAFWPALENFLRSYLEDGEVPPTPAQTANVGFVQYEEDRELLPA